MEMNELEEIRSIVFDLVRDIRDPEKTETLEELAVVYEDGINVSHFELVKDMFLINVTFTPTVPHCSLATLIGLCIRVQLQRNLPYKHKLNIRIKEGTHSTEYDINKQINDKERVAAAMENPSLCDMVNECLSAAER